MEHDLAKARNMKLVLSLFEQLTGLNINFHKSELFYLGRANDEQDTYRQLFGGEMGAVPFTYLGIPIHHRKLTNREWKCIEDRFEKKLSCWKGKLMSYGGRLSLIRPHEYAHVSSLFLRGSGGSPEEARLLSITLLLAE